MTTGKRMLLRAVEERDLELLLSWRNSERIRANMYTSHLIGEAEHRAWFERLMREGDAFAFVFEANDVPLGVVNLNHLDRRNLRCTGAFTSVSPTPPRAAAPAWHISRLPTSSRNCGCTR